MENIRLEYRGETAVLTVDRPKALNALNSATLREMEEALSLLEEQKDLRTVIVTGGGEKSFVAGADISEMVNASAPEGREMALLAKRCFERLEQMPVVTIAAVNGYALGGGCELAMACDIRVAAENAIFGQPECGLGILPGFGGTQRLARLVGKGLAKELIFTCRRIDAQEACRIGLVNQVVPQTELLESCLAMAEEIGRSAPLGVAYAKQAINAGLDTDLDSGPNGGKPFRSRFRHPRQARRHDRLPGKTEGKTLFGAVKVSVLPVASVLLLGKCVSLSTSFPYGCL